MVDVSNQIASRRTAFTEDEYLALERVSLRKHELVQGQILAMAGGSPEHGLLASNVLVALAASLQGSPCVALGSDVRVHVPATGFYTYPDVTVVCGRPERHVKDADAITNPRAIVEVLSDSTEAYDRGTKFDHYRSIPTLDTYALVNHREEHVLLHERQEDGSWRMTEERGRDAVLRLARLGVSIPLADVYSRWELYRSE
jgi:Uma2 family endonuclease